MQHCEQVPVRERHSSHSSTSRSSAQQLRRKAVMTLSECDLRKGLPDLHSASSRNGSRGLDAVEDLIDQLSDIIYCLTIQRPDSADGAAWLSYDAALFGLHGALVALDDFRGADRVPRN